MGIGMHQEGCAQPCPGDILEIGGGSGAMAAGLARRFPAASITVTDADAAMVHAARSQLAPFADVTADVADVTSLPFAAYRFDAVMSYLMLHHVIYWRQALAESSRVLKPGGEFLGYDLTDTRLARWVHQVDGSPHRQGAGFTRITVQTAAHGHLMRFHAHKPA